MSDPHWQWSPQTFGLALTAVLGFFGAIIAALLKWFGVRSTSDAPLQEALNHRVETLMRAWEAHDARSSAHISELRQGNELLMDQLGDSRRDVQHLAGELAQVQGDLANARQVNESLVRRLEAAGVLVKPKTPPPPPSDDEGGEDA